MDSQRKLLIGENSSITLMYIGLAMILLLSVYLSFSLGFSWYSLPVSSMFAADIGGIFIVVLAAWQSFQNSSLVGSIALGAGPVIGLFLRIIGEGTTTIPTLQSTILLSILWGSLFGIPIGIIGFVIGTLAKRLLRSNGSGEPRSSA